MKKFHSDTKKKEPKAMARMLGLPRQKTSPSVSSRRKRLAVSAIASAIGAPEPPPLLDESTCGVNLSTPLHTMIVGNFQIFVQGYQRRAQAVGEAPLFRHFSIALAQITGKAATDPQNAFEIVAVLGPIIEIRLKPDAETVTLPHARTAGNAAGSCLTFNPRHKTNALSAEPTAKPKTYVEGLRAGVTASL